MIYNFNGQPFDSSLMPPVVGVDISGNFVAYLPYPMLNKGRTFDPSGNLLTQSVTVKAGAQFNVDTTFTITYTPDSQGNNVGETAWVKQS